MEFKPTYLYIKKHKETGLKYFGKSTLDSIDKVNKYKGSGVDWTEHLKEFGNNVETEIVAYFTDRTECKEFAKEFSIINNIVESSEWANRMPENGVNGGPLKGELNGMYGKKHSKETRIKQGWSKGLTRPEHSKAMKGKSNPMYGKNYQVQRAIELAKSNKGKTLEEIYGEEKSINIKEKISLAHKGKKKDYVSKAQSGGNNSSAKPIKINNVYYSCIKEAMDITGLSRYKIKKLAVEV